MPIKDTRNKLKTSQQLQTIQQLGDNNYKEHTTKIATQDSFKKLQQKNVEKWTSDNNRHSQTRKSEWTTDMKKAFLISNPWHTNYVSEDSQYAFRLKRI